ncbi:Planctomycete cytochrome C [Pirellula sp. SH-Sr6A]|uniref:DUF1553 domain-containing protein n=1 Tax=Pirellula sp. SH-Sr6A TaxID=1632865 RepID=UPI00078C9C95|nr:DUF1553 domain-containing protein [Pirellula sp. SH-Sr6A]AMV32402.1 Planctomycete cytochrome C [Pirellula sp. SH-Sr6A]
MMIRYALLAFWFSTCLLPEHSPAGAPSVDFKREVRPILSNRCFACHGPDEEKIESGLRLDSLANATSRADSGSPAIVPGKASESEMIRRVLSQDPSERMPPPEFGAALSDSEVAALRAWIDAGATYEKHWSFDELMKTQPPPLLDATKEWREWPTSPIDSYVLKPMLERHWSPSPQADRAILLRRIYLDLIGLPPSLEELNEFLADTEPDAIEKRLDALLASPAYGEHWGRKWLDLARYADSAGYADDPQRTIWGYRDWVIRAFNRGMPFDQFTIEQLAGDLIEQPTEDQLVATAFHRNTLTNNEGGTNDEEFRNVAVVDRVNTTMSVWMGVTMACAQCHSHKYDPISQKEYFEVFAIFNQSQDADRTDESPTLAWFTPEQRQQIESWKKRIEDLHRELEAPEPLWADAQRAWEEHLAEPIVWSRVQLTPISRDQEPGISPQEDGWVEVKPDSQAYSLEMQWTIASKKDLRQLHGIAVNTQGLEGLKINEVRGALRSLQNSPLPARFVRIELPGEDKILSLAEVQIFRGSENVGPQGKATQSSEGFEGAPARAIDGKTDGEYTKNSVTHTEKSSSPWWEVELAEPTPVDQIRIWNRTDNKLEDRLSGAIVRVLGSDREGISEFRIEKGAASHEFQIVPSAAIPWSFAHSAGEIGNSEGPKAIDGKPQTGWTVGSGEPEASRLVLAIDSIQLGSASEMLTFPMTLTLQLQLQPSKQQSGSGSIGVSTSNDSRLLEWMKLPSKVHSVVQKPRLDRSDEEENFLHRYYVRSIAPEREALRTELASLEKRLADTKPETTVPVMKELDSDKRRETHVQLRGNYRVHGEQVGPGLPVAFHSYAKPEKSKPSELTRLDLAKWLVQSDNPLTPRVIANRYWEYLFGTGIVRTSEEFGSQGDLPTHPELLDHLATEWIRLEWDTKKFLRYLVLTRTYQQTSSVSAERFEQDPENLYFSRGPRFRASAEQIRDMALEAAGLLSHRMFGPPVRPMQPSMGLNAAFGSKTDWETSKGENRYRRALYTQWRRSNPYPSMATFDAPNREVCVLKRDRTNTPLQALVTLNDPVFVEAAQGLARRAVLREGVDKTFEARLDKVFELTLARKPRATETAALRSLLEEAILELEPTPELATKLATEPLGPLPDGASPSELAAWTALCNVVLNLDEFLMKP